jgi:hypothetical protein
VWIDGHQYFDRDRDLETRPKFEQQKKQLLDNEKAQEPQRTGRPANAGARRGTPMQEGQ